MERTTTSWWNVTLLRQITPVLVDPVIDDAMLTPPPPNDVTAVSTCCWSRRTACHFVGISNQLTVFRFQRFPPATLLVPLDIQLSLLTYTRLVGVRADNNVLAVHHLGPRVKLTASKTLVAAAVI